MLNWLNRFNIFCFLDSNHYRLPHQSLQCLAGAGARKVVHSDYTTALNDIDVFLTPETDWAFGHLGYDLKNAVENLHSSHSDHTGFADLSFFCPEILLELNEHFLTIGLFGNHHEEVYLQILSANTLSSFHSGACREVSSRLNKDEYISRVEKIKAHIRAGDCYELNFCQEFFQEGIEINPLEVYFRLNEVSPNPFSGLYRWNDSWCICASPERYLKKAGKKIISQPIKGTAPRNADPGVDEILKERLRNSEKERAENIMVVDLVRNDLSRICTKGSVKVDELCGIYSFPKVHQMISTISGELKRELNFSDIIKATFPMGSMTGAPKKKVMELIEQYEVTKRGLYSGAIGYISPERDFDFNVIIRSVLYNAAEQYLSFHTGSAITAKSNAEEEYEECLIKGEAIRQVIFK